MKKTSIAIALSAFLALSAFQGAAFAQQQQGYIKNYQRSPIGTSTRYNYGSVENIGYASKWPTNWPSGVKGYQCSAWPSVWGGKALPNYNEEDGTDYAGSSYPNGWTYRDSMTSPSATVDYRSWNGDGNSGVNGVKYSGSLASSSSAMSNTGVSTVDTESYPALRGFTGYQYAWWNRTATDGYWEPAWPGFMQPNWWPYRWQGLKSSGFTPYFPDYRPYASSKDPTFGWPKAAPDKWYQTYLSTGYHYFGTTSGAAVAGLVAPSAKASAPAPVATQVQASSKTASAAARSAMKTTPEAAAKNAEADYLRTQEKPYTSAIVAKASSTSAGSDFYTVTISYFDRDSGAPIGDSAYITVDGATGKVRNRSVAIVQFTSSFIANAAAEVSRGNFSAADEVYSKSGSSTMGAWRFRELFNEIRRASMARVMKGEANSEKITKFFDLRN